MIWLLSIAGCGESEVNGDSVGFLFRLTGDVGESEADGHPVGSLFRLTGDVEVMSFGGVPEELSY